MDIILEIAMMFAPPLLALIIHNYLRHGEMSGKRKLAFYILYAIVINACCFGTSYIRGVQGFRLENMTMTYQLKYIALGVVLGIFVPFPMCLLTEDQITFGGLKRYTIRFCNDIKKYMPYAIRSAKADLRSEVSNSYLDWLWWLIEPFCMMVIYTIIFGMVFNASEQYFPVFVFIGITMWSFFQRSVSGSVGTVRSSKGIITKIYMPKYILLLSKMFVNAFKMLVSFGIILLMMLVFRVPLTLNILYAIPIMVVLFLLTFGICTIMMHYGVFVSDLSYITGIILSMMMYFTGTFYSVSNRIPAPFGAMLEVCNPVAYLISNMRNALLYGMAPSWGLLGLWGVISIVLIALGAFTIYSNENSYVKVI